MHSITSFVTASCASSIPPLHQHQHLQLCLRFVLPNSKIFYLLCTYDPHAGTAGLSPIGLSESDTSVCCCCCCLLAALSAAFPSPSRRTPCKSVLCECVCVVFCLFASGWLLHSECHCNSLPLSLHSLFSWPALGAAATTAMCAMMDCVPGPICVCVCVCALTWAVAKSSLLHWFATISNWFKKFTFAEWNVKVKSVVKTWYLNISNNLDNQVTAIYKINWKLNKVN